MKTYIYIIFGLLFSSSFCFSQISDDYPFKTYLDSVNNLYVTGFKEIGSSKEIYIAKYPPSLNPTPIWSYYFNNPVGDDRGLDIAVDRDGRTYVTGYLFNSETNSNDIIVIAIHPDGTFNWSKTYKNPGDDKGMGIEIDKNGQGIVTDIYISGYVATQNSYKDFFIKKFNYEGDSLWQTVYGNSSGDDIATDILIDNNFAYVLGYSYLGPQRLNEIALLTFNQDYGTLQEALYDKRPGSDDKPTGFVIADRSLIPTMKSRIALASNSDGPVISSSGRKLITMFVEPSPENVFKIRWIKEYVNCSSCRNDAVTSISQDYSGDIYTAGYVRNTDQRNRGLDFLTMKYTRDSGNYGWPGNIRLFNYTGSTSNGYNDRASSIKINDQKDVYVAGVSDASPSGYSYVKYTQNSGQPVLEFDRMFVPAFLESNSEQGQPLKKWSTMHLANDGTPLMVVMGWNESEAHWAAIRYDANGNVLYTINNESGDLMNRSVRTKNISEEVTLNNYPNPFNPSTVISYSLNGSGFVSLKIYDVTGREVASPVKENQMSGSHTVNFNAGNLSSGVYYYVLTINGISEQRKSMILLR